MDWWSLGVLTYELLTGASPFTIEGDKNTQQDISKRIISAEPMMPDILSPDVKDFILKVKEDSTSELYSRYRQRALQLGEYG